VPCETTTTATQQKKRLGEIKIVERKRVLLLFIFFLFSFLSAGLYLYNEVSEMGKGWWWLQCTAVTLL
jgi:hypothetical protein